MVAIVSHEIAAMLMIRSSVLIQLCEQCLSSLQIEFLRPMTACILSERRSVRPFGILGGGAALAGVNLLLTSDGRQISLGGKNSMKLKGGDRLRILTPGKWNLPVRRGGFAAQEESVLGLGCMR